MIHSAFRNPHSAFSMTRQIREGDTVWFDRKPCLVRRITDCSAILEVPQERRQFSTIFGDLITIQPKPKTVRICATSELPIIPR